MKKHVLRTSASCDAAVDNKNESCTAATTTMLKTLKTTFEIGTTIMADIEEKERNLVCQHSLNTMSLGLQRVDFSRDLAKCYVETDGRTDRQTLECQDARMHLKISNFVT